MFRRQGLRLKNTKRALAVFSILFIHSQKYDFVREDAYV